MNYGCNLACRGSSRGLEHEIPRRSAIQAQTDRVRSADVGHPARKRERQCLVLQGELGLEERRGNGNVVGDLRGVTLIARDDVAVDVHLHVGRLLVEGPDGLGGSVRAAGIDAERRAHVHRSGQRRAAGVVFELVLGGIDPFAGLRADVGVAGLLPGDDEIALSVHAHRAVAAVGGERQLVPRQRGRPLLLLGVETEAADVNRAVGQGGLLVGKLDGRRPTHDDVVGHRDVGIDVVELDGDRRGEVGVRVVVDGRVGRILIDDDGVAQGVSVVVVALHRDVVEVALVLPLVGPHDDEIPVGVHGHVGLELGVRVVGVRHLREGVAVAVGKLQAIGGLQDVAPRGHGRVLYGRDVIPCERHVENIDLREVRRRGGGSHRHPRKTGGRERVLDVPGRSRRIAVERDGLRRGRPHRQLERADVAGRPQRAAGEIETQLLRGVGHQADARIGIDRGRRHLQCAGQGTVRHVLDGRPGGAAAIETHSERVLATGGRARTGYGHIGELPLQGLQDVVGRIGRVGIERNPRGRKPSYLQPERGGGGV